MDKELTIVSHFSETPLDHLFRLGHKFSLFFLELRDGLRNLLVREQ